MQFFLQAKQIFEVLSMPHATGPKPTQTYNHTAFSAVKANLHGVKHIHATGPKPTQTNHEAFSAV